MSTRAQDSVRVRRGAAQDAPALIALEQSSFDSDRLSLRQLKHHVRSPSSDVWVAHDGALLGYALVFHASRHRIARLYSIAVAAHARGRGVGRALMAAAIGGARERGAREMRLEVRQSNATAIALYTQLGFERFGERSGYYGDGEDAWRYRLSL